MIELLMRFWNQFGDTGYNYAKLSFIKYAVKMTKIKHTKKYDVQDKEQWQLNWNKNNRNE